MPDYYEDDAHYWDAISEEDDDTDNLYIEDDSGNIFSEACEHCGTTLSVQQHNETRGVCRCCIDTLDPDGNIYQECESCETLLYHEYLTDGFCHMCKFLDFIFAEEETCGETT